MNGSPNVLVLKDEHIYFSGFSQIRDLATLCMYDSAVDITVGHPNTLMDHHYPVIVDRNRCIHDVLLIWMYAISVTETVKQSPLSMVATRNHAFGRCQPIFLPLRRGRYDR